MNVALGIAQGVLAGVFVITGGLKLVKSKAELGAYMGWVSTSQNQLSIGIGVVEILGPLV
ncbi:MAG: hypothetical protein OEM39_05615 [Acidimicrobiia bacterium]|nr:hypothetical protein [Acidimicrobiia bacterium]MDH3463543.1 hypothetical protein [Acidimicrobiia bacterium]